MTASTRCKAPINRRSTMECVQVQVLTESNRIIGMSLPPGILPEDRLREMGIDEEFLVFRSRTTSVTY